MDRLRPGDPQVIGPYKLIARLGSGGMGVVFLGTHGVERVAIKVVRSTFLDDPSLRTRFEREIATLKRISSPYVAQFLDSSVDDEFAWHAVEFVNGPTLREQVDSTGQLAEGQWWDLAIQLKEALGVIHALGIIHRDVKPSNIVMSENGAKLIDFGISQDSEATSLTTTGMVAGSPAWLSPEQLEGTEVTAASDLYSAGSVLVFAATGRSPWGDETSMSVPVVYNKILTGTVNYDGLTADQRRVVQGLHHSDPQQRHFYLKGTNGEPPVTPGAVSDAVVTVVRDQGREVSPETPPHDATSRLDPRSEELEHSSRRGAWVAGGAITAFIVAAAVLTQVVGSPPPLDRSGETAIPAADENPEWRLKSAEALEEGPSAEFDNTYAPLVEQAGGFGEYPSETQLWPECASAGPAVAMVWQELFGADDLSAETVAQVETDFSRTIEELTGDSTAPSPIPNILASIEANLDGIGQQALSQTEVVSTEAATVYASGSVARRLVTSSNAEYWVAAFFHRCPEQAVEYGYPLRQPSTIAGVDSLDSAATVVFRWWREGAGLRYELILPNSGEQASVSGYGGGIRRPGRVESLCSRSSPAGSFSHGDRLSQVRNAPSVWRFSCDPTRQVGSELQQSWEPDGGSDFERLWEEPVVFSVSSEQLQGQVTLYLSEVPYDTPTQLFFRRLD